LLLFALYLPIIVPVVDLDKYIPIVTFPEFVLETDDDTGCNMAVN
jgi:hypothetical protein